MAQINRNFIKESSFTLVKVFLDNLCAPLRVFGTTIREILIEGEEMVALYSKEPTVCNKPTVQEFIINEKSNWKMLRTRMVQGTE